MKPTKNILIVDDDAELADLLAQAVSDISDAYQVKVATDVDEAMVEVNKAQTLQQPFDLVITDIKMAGLSGLELLEALESIAPQTKTLTMTAYNSPELAERARQLNVYAYLTKPFILSEFRQIVRNALSSPGEEGAEQSKATETLTPAQKVAVGRQLATLRTMTGATAALLIRTDDNVLAMDSLETDMDLQKLCTALVNMQQTTAQQMSQALGQETLLRQSYFGTDTYSTCTYRFDDKHFIAVVFGPAVKEGQIWYYMRETAKTLGTALTAEAYKPASPRSRLKGDVFDMLDQFFPDRHKPTKPQSEPTAPPRKEPEPTSPSSAAPVMAMPEQPQAREPATLLPSLDEINWDVSPEMSWDELVAETDQGFSGISLHQAQQQGLVSVETIDSHDQESQTEAAAPSTDQIDRPSVDDIDWEISPDMDWEQVVANTDQGFTGIDFQEAKRQGLVDNLE